jgi:hypothetical protein
MERVSRALDQCCSSWAFNGRDWRSWTQALTQGERITSLRWTSRTQERRYSYKTAKIDNLESQRGVSNVPLSLSSSLYWKETG